ncbi:hypothetical protein O0L34_g8192 [Tuta absoluta]|nr:hypothetical protein O0L34_g8192 [Tuta absoluta]
MDEEKAPVKSAKSVENKTPEKEIAENVAAKEKAENETEEQVAEKENSGPEIEQKESALNVGEEKENDEKENDEIDIYLFSNGQRYSPPRKYHLRTDDLKQWKATLCILARKQYGSLLVINFW